MSRARVERRLAKKQAAKESEAIKQKIERNLAANPCGECTACCTSLHVPELDKPEGTPCLNLRSDGPGCASYDIRPKSCRDFNCLWRLGLLELGDRPDKTGVIFDITAAGSRYGRQCLVAREVREGAIDTIMQILQQLASEGHLIILVQGERRRLMGPEPLVREAQEFMKRQLPVIPEGAVEVKRAEDQDGCG